MGKVKCKNRAFEALLIILAIILIIGSNLGLGSQLRAYAGDYRQPNQIERITSVQPNRINTHRTKIRSLHLLGERHSGTTWIQNHLRECFNHSGLAIRTGLHRWKHWFQEDGKYAERKAMVIVLFRHPVQWIEAMHTVSHHAPNHYGLDWYEFVTKPWTMEYFGKDLRLSTSDFESHKPMCQEMFTPRQVVPCLEDDFLKVTKSVSMRPNYELRLDASGKPYNSIVDLRRDKVLNFLSVANFTGVQDFQAIQYESLVTKGTEELLKRLEKTLGIKARCQPFPPKDLRPYPIGKKYMEWLKDKIDWDMESLIGYKPSAHAALTASL